MGGELRFQLWLLLGKTDRNPSVGQTGVQGYQSRIFVPLGCRQQNSVPKFSNPMLPASTFTWRTLSFLTFSPFLESVDHVPASGPLHLLFLLPQTFQGTGSFQPLGLQLKCHLVREAPPDHLRFKMCSSCLCQCL